jgi:beta-glucuronidase
MCEETNMLRRFRVHDLRPVMDLRGVWDFTFLGDASPDEIDVGGLDFDDVMAVPGCFDATPAYAGRRGLAAYRTRAMLPDRNRHRLLLDGVHHWCRVFVNGEQLRDHVGGFTRFSADFSAPAGEAEIVVLVDNRFDYERCPLHLDYFDWYHYGGVARGAELHALGPAWIEQLKVVTEDYERRRLSLTVSYAAEDAPGDVGLLVRFGGDIVLDEQVQLRADAGEVTRSFEAPTAGLWSPEEPTLHALHVQLGEDDIRERIGIRQVWTEGQKVVLNGAPIRLVGVNRHESHVQIGHGLPDALLVGDAQLLRDLGCNFVRGSHYPQDVRWLDLCDEMGFMVWSEVLGWQHTAEHLNDEHFIGAQLTNLEEMVAAARNHPSVVIYGILNESRSDDPECREGYSRLLGRLRELDPTRLLSYTSTRPENDLCFDLADVISVDIYPGWYHHQPADIPEVLDGVAETVDSRGFADKPLMMGEIGAGAIWGWRDWHAGHWSEQYQAEVLEAAARHLLLESDRWCGLGIWQLCDIRSSEQTARALGRPRSFNNKGLVDEYRRPKMAYDVVKRLFGEARGRR